jgi:hypothetical protein
LNLLPDVQFHEEIAWRRERTGRKRRHRDGEKLVSVPERRLFLSRRGLAGNEGK